MRALDHVRELLQRLPASGGEVVVIGSGFIGCEIAASLRRRGMHVTLVSDEHSPNAARLGAAAAGRIAGWLLDEDVRLELGATVTAIERRGSELRLRLEGSPPVTGGIVVMATGVEPRSELLAPTGLALEDGAVPVDASMHTEIDGLLAAGDVCKAHNVAAGRSLRVEHWGDALTQGELAGRAAAGADCDWDQVPGFWSTIGDHTLKYAAWGDGYDESRIEDRPDGAFVVWYGREGHVVGVLTHEADEVYESARDLIAARASWP